ncbi:MAG: hypothetical protein R6W67_06715 [Bacteroidales bacterium]
MKRYARDIAILSILAVFLFAITMILTVRIDFFAQADKAAALIPAFLAIGLGILGLSHAGKNKKPEQQTLFTLAAVGLKFLLPAILAVVWFAILKKTSHADVLLFFVVYLTISIATVMLVVKNLGNQP